MTVPPAERKDGISPQEGLQPMVCMTCGATYAAGVKGLFDTCEAIINFLTCSKNSAHNVVYLGDWKPGMSCTEKQYSGCAGVLEDMGATGKCPGRLTPQIQSSP